MDYEYDSGGWKDNMHSFVSFRSDFEDLRTLTVLRSVSNKGPVVPYFSCPRSAKSCGIPTRLLLFLRRVQRQDAAF